MSKVSGGVRRVAGRLNNGFDGLAGDTMWSAASDLLAAFTALVSVLLLTTAWDTGTYGDFNTLYALATIFSSITYSGPGLALLQRRFRFEDPLESLIRSYLSLAILSGLVSTVLAIGLSGWLYTLSILEIVVVVASELFANSVIWVCGWLVQAAVGFPAMARIRIVTTLLKLVAVPALYFTGQLTIYNLGLSYLVLYGAWAIFLVFVYLPSVGYPLVFGRPPKEAWKESVTFAVPLAASQAQMEGDRVVLGAANFRDDAGVYGLAFRIVLLGLLPIRVIQQAAFHRFLPDAAGKAGYHLRRVMQLSVVIFAVGLATAGGLYVLLFWLTPVIDLIIKPDYSESKEILTWLALFIPIHALGSIPLNGLLGLGRATERAYIYLSSAVVSFALYLLLIPGRGWEGALVATLVSEVYLVVASWTSMVYYQRRADSEAAFSVADGSDEPNDWTSDSTPV